VTRRDRALTWTAALCSLALIAPLAWPLVTGRVFVFDDLRKFHLPLRYLYANALRSGHLLLWTPAVYGGVYLLGEGQVGMLHPLHLLLYGLLPLQVAFNLEMIASYVFAFAGMRWLLRRLDLTDAAALVGAMLFAFSGFQLLHHHHMNVVAVTAHIPWLLACEDVLITADRRSEWTKGCAGVALVIASEVLLGFPQAVWWNLLAAVPFAVLRAGEIRRWRRLVSCAAAGLTGLLLGSVQLVPTLDAAAHSVRSGIGRTFALTYSLSPWNLVQFWAPRFFVDRAYSPPAEYLQVHELGIYSGTILMLAPVWVVMRGRALGSRRRLVIACLAFASVMCVLALGRYGGLDVLLTYLPVLGSLRAPARYIVLVQFALAIVAAIAFDDLVHGERAAAWLSRRRLIAVCGLAVMSVLTTALFNTRVLHLPSGLPIAAPGPAAAGTAIVVAVTVAFVLAARRASGAAAALIVLTALDLGVWGITYIYATPAVQIRSTTQADVGGPRMWTAPSLGNYPVMRGYQVVPGYLGLFPATTIPPDSDAFRKLAGARARLLDDWHSEPLDDAMPRARLAMPATAHGSAVVLVDEPGRIAVQASSDAAARLALTERFDAGWRVSVDGHAEDPLRIDGDFLGAAVDPGSHRVQFDFQPRSFALGIALSILGAVVMLVVALAGRGRTLKPPASATPSPPAP
jgi:hypothetical protein